MIIVKLDNLFLVFELKFRRFRQKHLVMIIVKLDNLFLVF